MRRESHHGSRHGSPEVRADRVWGFGRQGNGHIRDGRARCWTRGHGFGNLGTLTNQGIPMKPREPRPRRQRPRDQTVPLDVPETAPGQAPKPREDEDLPEEIRRMLDAAYT